MISFELKLFPSCAFSVFTISADDSTVTTSDVLATDIGKFKVIVWSTDRTTLFARLGLNPGSSALILYVPGCNCVAA